MIGKHWRSLKAAFVAGLLPAALWQAAAATPPAGPIRATWTIKGEPLTIESAPQFVGTISSLRFRGVEYLDAHDHGRLLSASVQFDGWGECLNPTLAGSADDGTRPVSSSRLLFAQADDHSYETATQMAYWMAPGTKHHVNPNVIEWTANKAQPCNVGAKGSSRTMAVNTEILSDVVYRQRMRPGVDGIPNATLDEVSVTTTSGHEQGVVQVLAAFMPANFDTFYLYHADEDRFVVDDTVLQKWGEQLLPAVLSTPSGSSAFAILSLSTDGPAPHYGRSIHQTTGIDVVELVFRQPGPFQAGTHAYPCAWIIGTLAEVENAVRQLARDLRGCKVTAGKIPAPPAPLCG
jgi:hypothetical protein